jgi:hypothetical protein
MRPLIFFILVFSCVTCFGQTISWTATGEDCSQSYESGVLFRTMEEPNGIRITAAFEISFGEPRLKLLVSNGSTKDIDVHPRDVTLEVLRPKHVMLQSMPPEKMIRRGGRMAAFQSVMATMHDADRIDADRIRSRQSDWEASANKVSLQDQTVRPQGVVYGVVWFPKNRANSVILRILIAGITYEIPFDSPQKK